MGTERRCGFVRVDFFQNPELSFQKSLFTGCLLQAGYTHFHFDPSLGMSCALINQLVSQSDTFLKYNNIFLNIIYW